VSAELYKAAARRRRPARPALAASRRTTLANPIRASGTMPNHRRRVVDEKSNGITHELMD